MNCKHDLCKESFRPGNLSFLVVIVLFSATAALAQGGFPLTSAQFQAVFHSNEEMTMRSSQKSKKMQVWA
jgi:hypothetical protein